MLNQQLTVTQCSTPGEIVNWMGAMQAQDFNQAKWAIGARLPHLTEEQVDDAFNRGEIIRTHLMRPTWHFVSPEDIHWLLELSARQIKSAMKARNRELELTEEIFKTSQEVIIKALEGNRTLTRDELGIHLNDAGISTNGQHLPHILMEAEIDGVICSGGLREKKQTYVLLDERVPQKKHISKDEALSLLAKRYFTSHGPATLADFTWWSGLPITEARKAIELNKGTFNSELIENELYWFVDCPLPATLPDSVHLLPAFDEYLVSYKNRKAAISGEDHAKAISKNGIFWPVVVVNGKISGMWKKTVKKYSMIVEIDHFRPHNETEKRLLAKAAEMLGQFYGKNVELR